LGNADAFGVFADAAVNFRNRCAPAAKPPRGAADARIDARR
jgi:hypothetical protein